MIGIPAYEEEKNIGRLLAFLCDECPKEVKDIYVVSSGSRNGTNEIAVSYSERNPKVHLIVERERKGKTSALNILLAKSEKYDVLICMGADNLPAKASIRALIDNLKQNNVDAVGGRPVPVNAEHNLMGFFIHLLWNLHHLVSLKSPKLSGELMAFKTGIVRELPPAIINDDTYLQAVFELKGHRVGYCHDAKVYLMGPCTLKDFIMQRRRVFVGHKQIEFLIGRKVPTVKWPKWRLILEACPFKRVKGRIYALLFVMFQAVALLLSKWDLYRNNLPYKWDMAKTTKALKYGI